MTSYSMEMEPKGTTTHAINGHSLSKDFHEGAVMSAHDINYYVQVSVGCCRGKEEKQILTDISAVFKQGMNAIMGPTGSGKSSFLDVLAGRKDPSGVRGTLLVDGKPVPENFKCMVGYVVQDDIVMGTLTVKENFAFSAALRLPTSVGADERKQRVEQVINELGLQKCADTKVGNEFVRGISGGEKKRCNIGMELIISPPVLFLDEPTTGLDANTASVVLEFLRKLSRRGRTIIFSIHQPRFSIYRLFDNLLLLSDGHTVFHGPAPEALTFFEDQGYYCQAHNNPPDFFLDVINGHPSTMKTDADTGENVDAQIANNTEHVSQHDKLVECYKKSEFKRRLDQEAGAIFSTFESQGGHKGVKHPRISYATPAHRQLSILAWRSLKDMTRNPLTFGATIASALFFSIVVMIIFWRLDKDPVNGFDDREGYMFFIVMNQVFFNMAAVELFILDRRFFIHENSSGFYRVSVYFLNKVLFDLVPLRLIPSLITALITYFAVGLRVGPDYFFQYAMMLFLICLSAACLCFLLSSTFGLFSTAQMFLALAYVIMMLFSGFLLHLNSIEDWISWLQYLSIFKYATAALYIIEMKDRVFCNETNYCESGNLRLERLDIDYESDWDLYLNVVALIALGTGFLMLTYIQLRRMKKTT